MCLPYSVLAMGPYSTGFRATRQPGLHSPTYELSCLRCTTFLQRAVLSQMRRDGRHRRHDRLAGRLAVGAGRRCARRLRPAARARRGRPLPHRLVAPRRRRCRRGARAGGHYSAGNAEPPLHLYPSGARLSGTRHYRSGTTGLRRFPASRASRVGSQTAGIRRPSRGADEFSLRSRAASAESAETVTVTATISRTIHVAHSPDADDAFMFWAMAAGKIDTDGRRYVHELGDIESLNRRALAGELEVTAVSLHAYAYLETAVTSSSPA